MDHTSWLIAAFILIGGEMILGGATELILLLLAVGCIAAGIAAYLGSSTSAQILIFAIVSSICLMGVRPVIKKHTETKTIPTNVDRYIEQRGIALSKITRTGGKILVLDNEWRAITESGEIEKGEDVKVLRVDGTKMIVEKI